MVVFFVDLQCVSGSAHLRKGKEHMSTEERVDVFRPEGSTFGSILGPVGVVTYSEILRCYQMNTAQEKKKQNSVHFDSGTRYGFMTSTSYRLFLKRKRVFTFVEKESDGCQMTMYMFETSAC